MQFSISMRVGYTETLEKTSDCFLDNRQRIPILNFKSGARGRDSYRDGVFTQLLQFTTGTIFAER